MALEERRKKKEERRKKKEERRKKKAYQSKINVKCKL
jgi:hypothetical protein